MATLLLSAAGGAIGAGFGGTILGLSGAVIGRAVGAAVGRAIDQRLLGAGSVSVETGRIDRLRLTSAGEGEAVGSLWGRMRVAGQVIWATRFFETQSTTATRQGKGSPSRTVTTRYSYSVSLAVALCEGEILRVGRVWADGNEIDPAAVTMRVYTGSNEQLPDPKIVAVEGAEEAPAYRGIAYVVFEDLPLADYGNRVPVFSFEVVRAAQGAGIEGVPDLVRGIKGVALIPGTGEYALATTPVWRSRGSGNAEDTVAVNCNAPGTGTDFSQSLRRLEEELPACGSVSLVVSWFGDDLRCGSCTVRPMVERHDVEGLNMPWRAGGITRAGAAALPVLGGGPVYGGTPSDQAVIEAIRALRTAGKSVMFYPFVLMVQMAGNGRPDPWSDAPEQPALPWRGRITLSVAPGRAGSPDGAAAAEAEIAAFFGSAQRDDFTFGPDGLVYAGPQDWGMRRFILHYAHLCAAAGGVDAFCIGSEMVALTRIRGLDGGFPGVSALRQLAADVRGILGPAVKIGYAADWSEYSGYQTGEGDLRFPLDPLWADEAVDFIGIDNYMPLFDWREGELHLDAERAGAIYDLDYLKANVEGGEGYDWYYAAGAHRDAQIRTPITDGAYGEPWVWRYKDIRNWWSEPHHERIGGERSVFPTVWVPRSKPVWFTEFGCAAVDKGTNQPNKFVDPKSSESALPFYSDGRRDELIQAQYLRAVMSYWEEPQNNPISELYGGPMIDMARAHVWAWDTRPYPQFPARSDLWADAENYARGHWISGRTVSQPLASVIGEICESAGVVAYDTSATYGLVRGYTVGGGQSGRSCLQPLMLAYGVEAVERDGILSFRMRDGRVDAVLSAQDLALSEDGTSITTVRTAEADVTGRVRILYVAADGDFASAAVEAVFPDDTSGAFTGSEMPLALTGAQAQATAERWLAEARVACDRAQFTLPPSLGGLGPGDVVKLTTAEGERRYRIDRTERAEGITVEAVRVEPSSYELSDEAEIATDVTPFVAPVPVTPVFLDLPLLHDDADPVAPYLAVGAVPWPGTVAVYSATEDAGYGLNTQIERQATVGWTMTPLLQAGPGRWDRGMPLRVRLRSGALSSASLERVLNGANAMAIGSDESDDWEIFQFATATPVAADVWDLELRLRGQLGTDAVVPEVWPIGSRIVLLDTAPQQITLAASARGLVRHYRIGTAGRAYDDPSYVHVARAFQGIGLRPYSPCHLRGDKLPEGGWSLCWTRRTRIDGDSWEGYEVPLGEAGELYLLRVFRAGVLVREATLDRPQWVYSAVLAGADGTADGCSVSVAQISASFGVGPSVSVSLLA